MYIIAGDLTGAADTTENMMNDTRPFIGISVGDPSGIGPEITARAGVIISGVRSAKS